MRPSEMMDDRASRRRKPDWVDRAGSKVPVGGNFLVAIALADFGKEPGRLFWPVRQQSLNGMAHVVKGAGRAGDRGQEALRLRFQRAADLLAARLDQPIVGVRWCLPLQTWPGEKQGWFL